MLNSGIYKITNLSNSKCYIGSSINIKKRWKEHKNDLLQGKHHSIALQRSWNKYGSDSFSFSILLYCSGNDLLFFEQKAIDTYKPEYNILKTAGSNLGFKMSEEAKLKISSFRKGKAPINKASSETEAQVLLNYSIFNISHEELGSFYNIGRTCIRNILKRNGL